MSPLDTPQVTFYADHVFLCAGVAEGCNNVANIMERWTQHCSSQIEAVGMLTKGDDTFACM